MQAQDKAFASNHQGHRLGGNRESSSGPIQTKPMRLEVSQYDGLDGPTIWLCRAEKYFEFQGTTEEEKLRLASYHMEGNNQIWIQRKNTLKAQMDWEEFKFELMLRFGTTPYEDGFGELCKLKQVSLIRDYQSHFERLLGKAGTLTDKQEMTYFISGLKEPRQVDVQTQNPITLSSTISLARICEGKNQEGKKGSNKFRPYLFVNKSPNQGARVIEGDDKKGNKLEVPVQRFTPAELQKRESKGLVSIVMSATLSIMCVSGCS